MQTELQGLQHGSEGTSKKGGRAMKNNVKTLAEILIELNNRKTELESQEENFLMQISSLERKLEWNRKEQRDVKTTIDFYSVARHYHEKEEAE
jgi:uncharacterized membrane protein YgaE (UPF0421/DUF939 family)